MVVSFRGLTSNFRLRTEDDTPATISSNGHLGGPLFFQLPVRAERNKTIIVYGKKYKSEIVNAGGTVANGLATDMEGNRTISQPTKMRSCISNINTLERDKSNGVDNPKRPHLAISMSLN